MIADAGAADGDDKIGPGRQIEGGGQRGSGVAGDWQQARRGTEIAQQRMQTEGVRGDYLVRAGVFARHDKLVAGRDEGDGRPSGHSDACDVHRRQERDVFRAQAPGRREPVTGTKISGGGADVGCLAEPLPERDDIAVAVHILLDHHAIGPGWHRSAGEDAHGLTGADLTVVAVARGGFADHLEPGPGRRFGSDHRVAVHGRRRERRLISGRDGIAGKHPAGGLAQRHLFAGQAPGQREEVIKRLRNRYHVAS